MRVSIFHGVSNNRRIVLNKGGHIFLVIENVYIERAYSQLREASKKEIFTMRIHFGANL